MVCSWLFLVDFPNDVNSLCLVYAGFAYVVMGPMVHSQKYHPSLWGWVRVDFGRGGGLWWG